MPTIKGKLKDYKECDKKKLTFEYAETKTSNKGGGPRGLDIWVEGVRGSKQEYDIEPNPHDSKKYNKQQSKFYKLMAGEAADKYDCKKGKFAGRVTGISWDKDSYVLN